jgi:hypothetical protein
MQGRMRVRRQGEGRMGGREGGRRRQG